MEQLEKVLRDAERHLEFSERSSSDLNRRIQDNSRACSVAERNVEESTILIANSERNLSILARQQSDTRKKLSALYRNLIAIPTSNQLTVDLKSSSNTGNHNFVTTPSKQSARDRVVFRVCLFNSLTTTGEVGCLIRHTHFVHSGLRQMEDVIRDEQKQTTQQMNIDAIQEEDQTTMEKVSVDALMPLCMYALTGTCTDKNCCFQHLEGISGSSSHKKTTTRSRSWRSLKLKKYLKQNTNTFAATISGLHDNNYHSDNDPGCYRHVDRTIYRAPVTRNKAINLDTCMGKNRYFSCPVMTCDIECAAEGTVSSATQDSSISAATTAATSATTAAATTSINEERLHVQRQSEEHKGIEVCLSHCHQLWVSCQVEAVCDCIYKCLQIESDLLPFCLPNGGGGGALNFPPKLQDFACSVKNQIEVNALYSSLVYMLVTGDFLGHRVLGIMLAEDGSSDSDSDTGSGTGDYSFRHIVNMRMLSSSRKRIVLEKLRNLLAHAPQLFEKIVCLLQQAHDAMRTDCEIDASSGGSGNNHINVVEKKEEKEEEGTEEGEHTCSRNDVCCNSNSPTHEIIWLCTALIAEVCLSTGSDGKEVDDSKNNNDSTHESLALLVNICADADRKSCRCVTREVSSHTRTQTHKGDISTEDDICENPSDDLYSVSQCFQNANVQSITSSLRLIALSTNTIKDISKQLTTSNKTTCTHFISDSLVLAALMTCYVNREIEFVKFVVNFLMICNNVSSHDSASIDGTDMSSSVEFTCGDKSWKLWTTSVSNSDDDNDEKTNTISFRSGDIVCHFTLLPSLYDPPIVSESDHFSNNSDSSCDDSDSNSDSVSESSICDSSGSESFSVVSKVELRHMLQEVFVHIFSIQIQSHLYTAAPGTENTQCNEIDVVISIWLCIAQVCSFFDPSRNIPLSMSDGSLSNCSANKNNNDKLMVRFFCNALVIQRKYIQNNMTLPTDNDEFLVSVSSDSVDVVGAVVLRMLIVFSYEQIQNIAEQASTVTAEHCQSNNSICSLLSLVTSVLVTVQYSHLQGKSVLTELSSSPFPLSNIFQLILHSVLKELRSKKLLSSCHIEHILCFMQRGRTAIHPGKGKVTGPAEDTLADFYVLFPTQHPFLLRKCFAGLLTSDILEFCFEMLNEEVSGNNTTTTTRFFQSANTPAIERSCLKYAQYLNPHDIMMTSLCSLHPDTLFQLAMVYFIAENFESLVIVQRILLDTKHPFAMYSFARVFSVCFESDSLFYHAEVMSTILDECKFFCSLGGDETIYDGEKERERTKRRRVLSTANTSFMSSWVTFQREAIPLLEHYSLDVLITLSDTLISAASSTNASIEQMQNLNIDLTNFSTSGCVPASLTALADTEYPVVSLNMSHNNFVIFPLVILDITTLLRLDLSCNMLSSMPSGIDTLFHLQVLNISHNRFIYFPSAVLKLKASLLELYLQDNKIEEIRNDFLKLSHLQVLDVSNNRLKNVPSRLNSHMKLKFFRFSGNPIFDTFSASQQPQNTMHSTHGHHAPGVFKFSSTSSIRLNSSHKHNKNKNNSKNKRRSHKHKR